MPSFDVGRVMAVRLIAIEECIVSPPTPAPFFSSLGRQSICFPWKTKGRGSPWRCRRTSAERRRRIGWQELNLRRCCWLLKRVQTASPYRHARGPSHHLGTTTNLRMCPNAGIVFPLLNLQPAHLLMEKSNRFIACVRGKHIRRRPPHN